MRNKKAQIELALMKGIVLALVVIGSLYIIEKITGTTDDGEKIVCEWSCEDASWSECVNGMQYRDIGVCNSQQNCRCVPSDDDCFRSDAKPPVKRAC